MREGDKARKRLVWGSGMKGWHLGQQMREWFALRPASSPGGTHK